MIRPFDPTKIKLIGDNNLPYASGFMFLNVLSVMQTDMHTIASYDINLVPYTVPQEEGFFHHVSGDFIDTNQYFIRHRTMGAWNTYVAQTLAGVQPDFQKETEFAQRRATNRLVGTGNIAKIGG